MVAPLIMNRPTRVFARLTFTGENKACAPACCDLSRVASIVPANPLPSNLGGAMAGEARPSMQCMSKDEKLSVLCNNNQAISVLNNSTGAKLDQAQTITNSGSVSPVMGHSNDRHGRKRAHESLNDTELKSKPVKIGRPDAEPGVSKHSALSGEHRGQKEMHHIDALRSENEVLKQQNKILVQKILAFQRILRSETNFEHARQKVTALESSKNRASYVEG
ncbi:hypothetical protein FHG87_012071 [Trinorchestia longiramus]|nr:hypothetical protein FHG87_012071 [Trinorchestia longiramus]